MQGNLTRKELHDYFAAEAMNGLVAGITDRLTRNTQTLAERAFNIADAMLAESDRREVQAKEITDPNYFVVQDN